MKKLIWLALLLPTLTFAFPNGDGGLTSVWSNESGGISCNFYDQK